MLGCAQRPNQGPAGGSLALPELRGGLHTGNSDVLLSVAYLAMI